jgi:hypothetical protein
VKSDSALQVGWLSMAISAGTTTTVLQTAVWWVIDVISHYKLSHTAKQQIARSEK